MFRAVVVRKEGKAEARREIIRFKDTSELPFQDSAADVLVQVSFSALNYKDGLVLTGSPGVARQFPLVPGIDFAGKVISDTSGSFTKGQSVVLTGHYAGQWMDGGYSDLARTRSDWLVPLPAHLTERQAMIIGTAGFTAMQCVMHLEKFGGLLRGETDPVLVTGAGGGVGSVAVAILNHLGYNVVASTGREAELAHFLKKLGAKAVIGRLEASRPLNKETYAGVVDCVGGVTLASALASVKYGRAVAACGLAGSNSLPATVLPFILRGVKLLGIDSVQADMQERKAVWEALGHSLPQGLLEELATVYSLEDVSGSLGQQILKGQVRGRGIIDMGLGKSKL
eukprot:TRINITY_DN96959_c0_g1_i1.p1 TRINITY_DN96959_c0_g1~~TRINITY_DN96959_c0_g1_i1.p1  ORF type:complete len:340 (+),score=64.27 TRINITY_DN96959_c0_g1_i1:106-1125(+)